jgi:hypothetical protein
MILALHVLQNSRSATNLTGTLLGSFNTCEIGSIRGLGAWSFTHFRLSRLGSSKDVTVEFLFRVKTKSSICVNKIKLSESIAESKSIYSSLSVKSAA